ncbi:MAG: hypothetical protein ACK5M7_20640 [Draconibacterium sp.]
MKPKILKLSALFLSLLFIGAGCNNDEDLFELQIGDKNAVIQQEVNGIEFTFCLLNEAGEPATVFNEGENFTFRFSIQNKNKQLIYFDQSLMNSNEFCEVKNNTKSFGKPFEIIGVNEIGKIGWSIPENSTTEISVKWIPDSDTWNISHFYLKNKHLSVLSKGIYLTEFSQKFDLETLQTKKLTFKINFEIK